MIVFELMSASRDVRIDANGRTASVYASSVIPEKRVLKSLVRDDQIRRHRQNVNLHDVHDFNTLVHADEFVVDFLA